MRGRVLLVDDEEDIGALCARRLRGEGFEVTVVESLAEALEAGAPGRYDVLVSDIVLGDGNGLDAAAELLDADPALKLVVITGSPTYGARERAERLGARAFLYKPFRLEDLARAVAEACAGGEAA